LWRICLGKSERRLLKTSFMKYFKDQLSRLVRSRRALAIPVTYLILFVSLIALISLTYSFAITRISSRGALLKASVARHNIEILDDAVRSVLWSYGASKVVSMDDCGGTFRTTLNARKLVLNFTDERSPGAIVFNNTIGKALYELEPSTFGDDGLYVRGDDRVIINETRYTITQLYVATGNSTKNIILCYRPLATVVAIGTSNGKPLNLVRVYVVNLNTSQSLMLTERFCLKVTSTNTTVAAYQYTFTSSIPSVAIKAVLDGRHMNVRLPLSSSSDGAVVKLEVVVCNVKIQSVEV